MVLDGINLIAKKILVGVIVTVIPGAILIGGLWLTHEALHTGKSPAIVHPR